ncbi:hypothetical protein M2436_005514 [Streptomyces sp. HB372]|nr:hypothetical protein [Streptomyces sp. HB372]
MPSEFCERASRARRRTSRPAVGSGTSSAGGAGASATGGLLRGRGGVREADFVDGAPRFVARRLGLLADLRFGGRSDGRRARRRGRQLLLAAAYHEPADQADSDQGDDYSEDDDFDEFHNPSSIGHGRAAGAAPADPRRSIGAICTFWR